MEDKITAVAACSSCSRTFETGKIEIILTFKISGKDPSSIFANSRVHQHSDSQEPEPTYFLVQCGLNSNGYQGEIVYCTEVKDDARGQSSCSE